MIALRNNLPLLEDHSGEVRAIDSDWLLAALERAAIKAGFVEWWLAGDVISSVFNYLSGCYENNVVAVGRLQAAVRRALSDVGYVEIAEHFEADSSTDCCSLLWCAQSLPEFGLEAFHLALNRQIRVWRGTQLRSFHFQEMSQCLRFVEEATGTKVTLRKETLVAMIRDSLSSLVWEREIYCSIA